MCNTSARGFAMKAPFNNNLKPQTGDVIVNPKNPVILIQNYGLLLTEVFLNYLPFFIYLKKYF
jgi:hypothetical protein